MNEVEQFVAVDVLLDAAVYLRRCLPTCMAREFSANCQAREIIYDAMSKVLDTVDAEAQP